MGDEDKKPEGVQTSANQPANEPAQNDLAQPQTSVPDEGQENKEETTDSSEAQAPADDSTDQSESK